MKYKAIMLSDRWYNLEDLPNEIWKPIPEFEGRYEISTWGRVKSIGRFYKRNNNIVSHIDTHIMKLNITGSGTKKYYGVHLKKEGKRICFKIHRLVAKIFIPNPLNYPCVNHKNENKLDNRVENLEWCTYSYNNCYNGLKERMHEKKLNTPTLSYPMLLLDKDMNLIREFPSYSEAARVLGVSYEYVRGRCRMNVKRENPKPSKDGYIWLRKPGISLRENGNGKRVI